MEPPLFHSCVFSFLSFLGRARLGRTCSTALHHQRNALGHRGLVFRWVVTNDSVGEDYCRDHVRAAHQRFTGIRALRRETAKHIRSMGTSEPLVPCLSRTKCVERIVDAAAAVRGWYPEYAAYSVSG